MKKLEKIGTVLLTTTLLTVSFPVSALSKDETVYSKLNSDGSVKKTVVSEYLKNTDEVINDKTDLQNILNINGTETFKLEGSNLVWDAKGKDIYYQGETNKELPVSLDIKYSLDGKDIELKDLLGKKGNVKITLKYTNHDKHQVLVNGSYQTLYTPFVVTMGTIISNENNSNIQVSNGRIVSNGKSSVVVAIASPGLYESLNTSKLKDFDTITVSFDTTKFELSSMYSVVSSKLISHDDLNVFHKFDSVYSKIDTLSNSSKQLVEGSNKLSNGANLLSKTLTSKINELENTESIDNTKLEYIKTTVSTAALKTVESKENDIKAQGQAGVDTYINTLKAVIDNAESQNAKLAVLYANNICGLETIPAEYQPYCADSSVQQYLAAKKMYMTLQNEDIKALVKNVSGEIAYATAKSTAKSTAESTSVQVSKTVADTAKQSTVESLKTLNANIATLTNGIDTLAEGITRFDNEGINAIANFVNSDVKTTQAKLDALMKLGKAYDSFTMKDENTDGETKFVLVVDSQKAVVKNSTKKESKTKKESFLDKISKIFKK